MSSTAVVAPLTQDLEMKELPPAEKEVKSEKKKKEKQPLTDSEKKTREDCCNLIFYICFLCTFLLGTYLARGDENGYYMVEKIKDEVLFNEFLTSANTPNHFYGVTHWDDMWRFINGDASPIRGFLLAERSAGSGDYMREYLAYNQSWPNGGNVLLGGLRIRQVRVTKDLCMEEFEEYTEIEDQITQCNSKFYTEDEETEDLDLNEGRYSWVSADEIGESSWWGKLASYPGSGYYVDIPPIESEYIRIMDELKADNWITPGITRAVFLDFQLYNPAANLHFAGRCAFELPHTGGVRPKADFFGVKLFATKGGLGKLQVTAELFLWTFCLLFILIEIKEIRALGCKKYWQDSWNYIDWANIIVLMCNLGLSAMLHLGKLGMTWDEPIINGLGGGESGEPEFQSMVRIMVYVFVSNLLSSVNALMLWIKLFRFLSFSPRMKVIFDTLGNAAVDLSYFGILFAVFTMGFAHAGYLAFAGDVYSFRSISQSAKTLLLSIFDDMDAEGMSASSRLYGPVYIIAYQMCMLMILVNVFLAIINDSYADVSEKAIEEEKKMQSTSRKSTLLKNVFSKSFGFKVAEEVVTAVQDTDSNQIGKDELIEKLVSYGMDKASATKKVEETLEHYDKDANDVLDKIEIDNILESAGLESPRQKKVKEEKVDASVSNIISELRNVKAALEALDGEIKDNKSEIRDL